MNPQQLNWLQALFYVWQAPNHTHILYEKEQIIRQCYGGMKEKHGMETITLFHVGDSYEAYFEDAETISRIMEAPLFQDDGGEYSCCQDIRYCHGGMPKPVVGCRT